MIVPSSKLCSLFPTITIFILFSSFSTSAQAAFRYENRTIQCSTENAEDKCILTAPDTKLKLDFDIQCRREPMGDDKRSQLRLACPIRCPKDYEVHVLQKIPSSNKKCTKFYTYGKYQGDEEWFIWMVEPCITTISTHCRYPEV